MQRQENSYESFSLDEYTLDVEDFFNDYIIHKSTSSSLSMYLKMLLKEN